jgi:hypothetical protein
MKYIITVIALLAIVILSNFQPKPVEYRIVYGYSYYYPEETTVYYLWDGTSTSTCNDVTVMLTFMQRQGFELVSVHSNTFGNSGGHVRIKETWIFKNK